MGLGDIDDPVGHPVGAMREHLLLLPQHLTEHQHTMVESPGEGLEAELLHDPIDIPEVAFEVGDLLPHPLAPSGHGDLLASCDGKVLFSRLLPIRSRFWNTMGLAEGVDDLFRGLPGFVQKRQICRMPDIGRRTGRINDQLPPALRFVLLPTIRRVRIIGVRALFFGRHGMGGHDPFIDVCKDLRRKPLSEMGHAGRVERRLD